MKLPAFLNKRVVALCGTIGSLLFVVGPIIGFLNYIISVLAMDSYYRPGFFAIFSSFVSMVYNILGWVLILMFFVYTFLSAPKEKK